MAIITLGIKKGFIRIVTEFLRIGFYHSFTHDIGSATFTTYYAHVL